MHVPYCIVIDVASGTEKVGALVQGYMQLMKYGYIHLFEQRYMSQTVHIGISVTSGTARGYSYVLDIDVTFVTGIRVAPVAPVALLAKE